MHALVLTALLPVRAVHAPQVTLQEGDVVIMGSRGLFDMVWLHGTPSTNLRRELYQVTYAQVRRSL